MKALRLTGAHAGATIAFGALQFTRGVSQHITDADAEIWEQILADQGASAESFDPSTGVVSVTPAQQATPTPWAPKTDDESDDT